MSGASTLRSCRHPVTCLLAVVWIGALLRATVSGEPPAAVAMPPVNESLSSLAQRIVIDSLPKQFEDDRGWGRTTKVMNGLHLREDGDRLKLEKHTKEVKDGIWK